MVPEVGSLGESRRSWLRRLREVWNLSRGVLDVLPEYRTATVRLRGSVTIAELLAEVAHRRQHLLEHPSFTSSLDQVSARLRQQIAELKFTDPGTAAVAMLVYADLQISELERQFQNGWIPAADFEQWRQWLVGHATVLVEATGIKLPDSPPSAH